MTSAGEHQERIEQWVEAFEELPPERQDNLKRWFAVQKVIIESSGLSAEEWFRYVQWAMDNPFDYEFIKNFPDSSDSEVGADAAEIGDKTRDARKLVGAQTGLTAPDGPGIQGKAKAERGIERELFDRFMRNRLGGGGRK